MNPKLIIKELEKLVDKNSIDASGLFDYTEEFNYEPIKHYLKSIAEFQTKPESASHELFKIIIKDVLKFEAFNEVSVSGGFVDFVISFHICLTSSDLSKTFFIASSYSPLL